MCVNVEIGPVGDTTKGFSQKTVQGVSLKGRSVFIFVRY